MVKSTEEVLKLNTKGQRNLSMKDLKEWYTEDELRALKYNMKYPANSKDILCDTKFLQPFNAMKELAKKQGKRHRWTPDEDAFLKSSFMFISDQIIGLALNMPVSAIVKRRQVLRLIKGHISPIEVLVWCNRDDFERDVKLHQLTKARPELRELDVRKTHEDEGKDGGI